MPRLKYKKKGKRVNLWIPNHQMKTAAQIDNLSQFLQICLDQAADIMAWAILKDIDPIKYKSNKKVEDYIDEYNEKHPLDPLTQRREENKQWLKNSPKKQDLW